jgi:chlorobactene glucosyltransferase
MLLTFTAGFAGTALLILLLTSLLNWPFFPSLEEVPPPAHPPRLSILIPARNEAAVIGQTITAVLAQSVAQWELIVLDDGSTDGTAALIHQAAQGDPRVRLQTGQPLPTGWLGKNWACHQLSQSATGELLLFIDADVRLAPSAVAALLALQSQTQADLLTIWPSQITPTTAERLVVPLISFVIFSYLPILPVHHTHSVAFAAANGQCLLFRQSAYAQIGGHTAVRGHIVEDVMLAKAIKRAKLRLRMADGNQLVACRMYTGWPTVRDGLAKNIIAGHGQSVLLLLASTLFHWVLFVWPWLWLAVGGGGWAAVLIALGVVNRWLVGVRLGRGLLGSLLESLLMPVSVLLFTRIAAQAVYWRLTGGPLWKGRRL